MKRKLAALFAVGSFVLLGAVVVATSSEQEPPLKLPQLPAPDPSLTATPGKDAGAGIPGAHCATNRVGMWFEKEGSIYICAEPAPTRWRLYK